VISANELSVTSEGVARGQALAISRNRTLTRAFLLKQNEKINKDEIFDESGHG